MAIDTLEFCRSDRRYPGNQTKCRGTAIKLLPWPQNWRKRTNKKMPQARPVDWLCFQASRGKRPESGLFRPKA